MSDSAASRLAALRGVPYFAALPEQVLLALADVAVMRRYARGEVIFLEGEPCTGLFVLAEGEIKIFKLSLAGREQILQVLGPGATFNDVAVLDGGANPASAAAASPAAAYVIARRDLRRLAEAHPALAWALIESIAHRARQLVDLVEDLALRSVKARLARLLLSEAERSAGQVEIGRAQMITQSDMAARLGTVREMVGRALRDLTDAGLIAQDRHRLVILDRARLRALAEGE